jgi:hypothetical protein
MQAHSGHWPIWAGFLLRWIASLSSCLIFVWFPVTRDVPWANLLLLGIAAALVLMGVRRACAPERPRRATSAGVALATLSVAMCGGFVCATVMLARRLLASHRAPQMGQKAPDFRLSETHGTPVSLAELLAAPVKGRVPKGVLLVFYAGAW